MGAGADSQSDYRDVYPDGAESEFAAVHSFLQRLERKGLVARDRSSFVHVFAAKASQSDILGQELQTLVSGWEATRSPQ